MCYAYILDLGKKPTTKIVRAGNKFNTTIFSILHIFNLYVKHSVVKKFNYGPYLVEGM